MSDQPHEDAAIWKIGTPITWRPATPGEQLRRCCFDECEQHPAECKTTTVGQEDGFDIKYEFLLCDHHAEIERNADDLEQGAKAMQDAEDMSYQQSMGKPTQLNLSDYDLIIFDLDHTLVVPRIGAPNKPQFRAHAHDWQVIPGVLPVLTQCRKQGVELAIATNQGGVAFGILHPLDVTRAVQDAAYFMGIYFVYIAFDHPNGTRPQWCYDSIMRKPGRGMLMRAMEDAHTTPERTLFVGDMGTDEEAATQAMCEFMRAEDFFGTVQQLMDEQAVF